MTIVCATNEGLFAKCQKYLPGKIRFEGCANGSGDQIIFEAPLDSKELSRLASQGGFFSYVAGTAASTLLAYGSRINEVGIRIVNYRTTLPMKKGLSSSAAVCVLIAKCFNEVFHLGLERSEIMELAYKGEMLTPSQCGRMDQVCSASSANRTFTLL